MSEVLNKDHLYTMFEKHNLHKQTKKMHNNPRKVLSEGHTQANSQIQKNIQKRKFFRRISGEILDYSVLGYPWTSRSHFLSEQF